MNDNGSLDTTFTQNLGTGPDSGVDAITIQPDGKILVGGRFLNFNGVARRRLLRLNADGSLDTTFSAGLGPNQPIVSIQLQPDGKSLICGNFTSFNGVVRAGIVRLNTDGSVDNTFDPGAGASGLVNGAIVQADGKIIVYGGFNFFNNQPRVKIVRLEANGTIDAAYAQNTVLNSDIRDAELLPSGKLTIVGVFFEINGLSRRSVARLAVDGSHDTAFNPGTAAGYLDSPGSAPVNASGLDAEGRLVIVGEFRQFNDIPFNFITRVGTADPTPPLLITHPTNLFILTGSNASFAVTASGSDPLRYQWRFNGTDIPGATNNPITIPNAQASNEGLYSVVVANSAGTATSSNASLTLGVFPFFVTPPQSVTNFVGANESFSVTAGGTAPLSYQWFFGGAALPGQTNPTLARNNIQLSDAGLYTIVVSNLFGAVTNSATLTVPLPPSFAAGPGGGGPDGQPQSLTVVQGQTATFSANAIGSAPLTYQWRFAGVNIPGATSSSHTIPNAQTAQAGLYSVVVSNPFGSTASANATLTVLVPPSIVPGGGLGGPDGQPQSLTVLQGQNATFSANAVGTAPLTYQWRFGGANIPGANSPTLTLNNVLLSQAGLYSVVISNSGGTATSANATLTVLSPPTIAPGPNGGGPDGHPQSLTVVQGQNATFSVNATGTAPLTYQWRFGGVNISGATNTSVTLTNVLASQAGLYSVVISNSGGSTTSSNATLTVIVPPAIVPGGGLGGPDGQPQSLTVLQGQTATFSANAVGTAPLTYQWRVGGANIPGANSPTLTLNNVVPSQAGLYSVVISNTGGTATSANATLTVLTPPAITPGPNGGGPDGHPQSLTVVQGQNATFSVNATGTAPLTYQWRFGGVIIPGANSTSVTLFNVQPSQAGLYSVDISNSGGSITSSNATLTVIVPPTIVAGGGLGGPDGQPQSLTVVQGQTATFSANAVGTAPLAYQWRFGGANIPGANSPTLTLNNVVPSQAGLYSVVISNTGGTATSANATLTVLTPPAITPGPNGGGPDGHPQSLTVVQGQNATFSVNATGTAPLTYQWRFGGVNIPGATSTSLPLTNVQASQAGLYSVVISNAGGSTISSNATLTVLLPPTIIVPPVSQILTQGSTLNLSVTATGSPTLTYQWRFNGANFPGATAPFLSLFNVQESAQGDYTVVVSNPYGSVTSVVAVVTVQSPPNIFDAGQPQPQTVLQGNNATFSVTAVGDAPFTYQWRFGGVNIPGATSNPLVLTGVQTNQAGDYSVVVSNPFGTAVSANALLTVRVPPFIVTQPTPGTQTVVAGGNATITVVAGGDPTLTYQWRLNGANVPGATAATLTLTGIQTNQLGLYSVVVSNPYGSVTSSTATLDVKAPPFVASQPQSLTVLVGSPAAFSVTPGGDGPFTYQWRFGGVNLAGATNPSFGRASAVTNDAGLYSVVISSPYGTVISSNATLTVNVPPFIITQPTPATQTVVAGSTATIAVVAGGDPTLTYQWRLNGVNVPGATGATLTLAGVQTNQLGLYSVVVSNPFGSVTSSTATLDVKAAPFVASQPQSLAVLVGSPAAFSVTPGGDGPFTYQWRFAGVNLAGATNPSFGRASAVTNDAGLYSVVISSPYGTVISSNATLTVNVPPTIVTHPQSLATVVGSNATFTVTAIGDPTLTYQWRFNGTPIGGANAAILTLANVQASQVGLYSVVVSNPFGTAISTNATLTVHQPPAIAAGVSQPQPQTVIQGNNATFSVTATGDAPLAYQWQRNGVPIPGAIGNPLVLTGVQTNQAGNYSVVVSNPYGSVTSSSALLTVRVPPFIVTQPVSQSVNAGLTVSFAVVAGGDPTLTYQWRLNGNPIAGAISPTLTLANVQASQAGLYSVVVSNPYGTAVSGNATLTVTTAPFVASHPQSLTVLKGTNAAFSVAVGGDGPFTYQWLFAGGTLAGATNNPLALTNVQTNQAGLYSVVITSPFGTATSSNATLTVLDPPVIVVQPVSVAALAGDNVTFFVGATGRPTLRYQWCKNDAVIPGATNLTLTLTNVATADVANYSVKVSNSDGSVTSVTVSLSFTQRTLQVVSTQVTSATTNFTAGTAVSVPVALTAEGGENRVTASVAYDTAKLTLVSVTAGPGGATLASTNAAAQGLVFFDFALAPGQSFTPGSNVVVFLNFTVTAGVTQSIASLMLQGTPVANQVLSTTGAALPAYYLSGAVILKSLADYSLRAQTGATEEALPIFNPAGSVTALTFLRISFFDLGNDSLGNPIRLINATGTNNGVPFVLIPTAIVPAGSFPLHVEYYVSDRVTKPNPRLVVEVVTGGFPATPAGTVLSLDRVQFHEGRFKLDFASQAGKTYYIQYSSSVAGPYETSFPGIVGTGGNLQWVDTGPPRTTSLPTSTGSRFYRLLQVP